MFHKEEKIEKNGHRQQHSKIQIIKMVDGGKIIDEAKIAEKKKTVEIKKI